MDFVKIPASTRHDPGMLGVMGTHPARQRCEGTATRPVSSPHDTESCGTDAQETFLD
jgi:hypothetical protein